MVDTPGAGEQISAVQSQLDNLTLLSPPGFSLDLDPAAKLEASQAKLGSIVGELSAASPAAKAAKVSGDACNIFDSMGSLLSGPQEAIGAAADAAGDIAGGVGDAAGGALSAAQEAAGAAAGAIGDSIGGAKDAIGGIMGQVGDLSAAFDEALPDIQGIAEGLKGASQEVLDVALPAFEGLNSAVAGINESVFGGIEGALSSATDVLGEALDIGGAAGCESSAKSAENLALNKAEELGFSVEDVTADAANLDEPNTLQATDPASQISDRESEIFAEFAAEELRLQNEQVSGLSEQERQENERLARELEESKEFAAPLENLPDGALDAVKGDINAPSLRGVIQSGANEGLALVESAASPGKTLADLGTESINGALAGADQAAAAIGPATDTMKSTINTQMNLLKNLPI
jgi:hypothetical protein